LPAAKILGGGDVHVSASNPFAEISVREAGEPARSRACAKRVFSQIKLRISGKKI